MVNFPVFADASEVGGFLSGGIAMLNPRLLIRLAFPCFARFPHLFDQPFATDPNQGLTYKKREENSLNFPLFNSVRAKGLEPPRLTTLDPKSSAATNYATRAGFRPQS